MESTPVVQETRPFRIKVDRQEGEEHSGSCLLSTFQPPTIASRSQSSQSRLDRPLLGSPTCEEPPPTTQSSSRKGLFNQTKFFFFCNLPILFTSKGSNHGNEIRKVKKYREPAEWKGNEHLPAPAVFLAPAACESTGLLKRFGVSWVVERPPEANLH